MIGGIGAVRGARALLVAAFVAVCGLPYVRWAAHPTLFDDDFLRVGGLRRSPLAENLFRPFNEHLAPLFEVVSWLAWRGSGRSVEAIPTGFLVASYLAFLATVGMLGAVAWRETRSRSAAMAGVAAFALSSVSAESVLWYSASSFQWAAAATLGAWLAASMAAGAATSRRRAAWLAASAIASACAPAFSAIGVLAGPLAALRVLSADGPGPSIPARIARSSVPLIGPGAFFLVGSRFRYGAVVASSVGQNLDLGAATSAAIRAPGLVLLPGLVGLPEQAGRIPGAVAAALTIGLMLAGLILASRRGRDRPLILGGLALIAGGYLAAFATRARPGDLWVFRVQRYHLFPQVGLACLVAALLAPRWRLLDRRPLAGLAAASALAAALAVVQAPGMDRAPGRTFRDPDQPRAIAATLRLERTCRREGVTLIQAMAALEPIRNRWLPQSGPFNPLLHLFGPGPEVARVPDGEVRAILIGSMSPGDREAIFGGMEATRYRMPASAWDGAGAPVEARLEAARGASADYRVGPEADDARALALPGLESGGPVRVQWADESGDWSDGRSVRWLPAPGGDWAVALDLLPHWRRGSVRRLRLGFAEPGDRTLSAPRFLR